MKTCTRHELNEAWQESNGQIQTNNIKLDIKEKKGYSSNKEKIREKDLLKEFQIYVESKGKLKQFRLEAIRAGFKKKWSENDYKSIVSIAQRLPEQIIQEDSSLLMYYDNALSRWR